MAVGHTPAEQADAYASLLDALAIDSVAVIGASGGGPSAIEFSKRYPERIESLILYAAVSQSLPDTSIPPTSSVDQVTNVIFGQGFLEWSLTRILVWFPESGTALESAYPDSWSRILVNKQKTELFAGLVQTNLTHFPLNLRVEGYQNDMEQFGQIDLGSLTSISAPTLIMHGTADTDVPIETAQALSQAIAGAQTVWVADADHFMILSRRKNLGRSCLTFWQCIQNACHPTIAGQ